MASFMLPIAVEVHHFQPPVTNSSTEFRSNLKVPMVLVRLRSFSSKALTLLCCSKQKGQQQRGSRTRSVVESIWSSAKLGQPCSSLSDDQETDTEVPASYFSRMISMQALFHR
jgi:hypothetical protein